jgi:prepilin signal peptidase PulO-like enzyme (type II secretory pathway)
MAVAAAAVALLRALASWYYGREAMGFGDVFLVGAIAANIGWSELIVTFFFLAVFIALAGGLLLHTPRVVRAYRRARVRDVARRARGLRSLAPALARHSFRKLEMPFGPSLAVAAVVTLLYGGSLTASYRDWAHVDVTAAAPLALPPPPPYTMP